MSSVQPSSRSLAAAMTSAGGASSVLTTCRMYIQHSAFGLRLQQKLQTEDTAAHACASWAFEADDVSVHA